jgi:hypothetical protein
VASEARIDRRQFVGAIAAGVALVPRLPGAWAAARAKDPFSLGVASGDPLPDGMVLWTRVQRPGPVRWDNGDLRVGHEGPLPVRIEPVDGMDQTHPGDLHQILAVLSAAGEPPSESHGEGVVVTEESPSSSRQCTGPGAAPREYPVGIGLF